MSGRTDIGDGIEVWLEGDVLWIQETHHTGHMIDIYPEQWEALVEFVKARKEKR